MKSESMISSSNPLVKLARSLRQRKNRVESGLFLVEGIHNVGAAVEAGWGIHAILYSIQELGSDFGTQLIAQQEMRGIECHPLPPALFNSVAEKENPQGILAIVHQRKMLLDEITPANFQWGVAAISPQDPGNVGSLLRTIESVGADGLILLDGGVDVYHPSSVRASMGSIFWIPTIQSTFLDFVRWAHLHAYLLIGSSAHAEMDYRKLHELENPRILMLGNEQKGMTAAQIQACDMMVTIPMRGHSSSLNLSVAAGILLYGMQ